jgi:hypothetical protein
MILPLEEQTFPEVVGRTFNFKGFGDTRIPARLEGETSRDLFVYSAGNLRLYVSGFYRKGPVLAVVLPDSTIAREHSGELVA